MQRRTYIDSTDNVAHCTVDDEGHFRMDIHMGRRVDVDVDLDYIMALAGYFPVGRPCHLRRVK